MTRPDEVADVLEEAAALLETVPHKPRLVREHNWQQGAYGVGSGPFCAVGALREAAGIGSDARQVALDSDFNRKSGLCDAAMRTLELLLPADDPIRGNVVRWNDADGQTVGNVATTMRRAAAVVLP